MGFINLLVGTLFPGFIQLIGITLVIFIRDLTS